MSGGANKKYLAQLLLFEDFPDVVFELRTRLETRGGEEEKVLAEN